jgi:hypothetical protein
MQPFPKKDPVPDFSKPSIQESFVQNTQDAKTLMQKELDVNRAEQSLLKKRLEMAAELINQVPETDPQYSPLIAQLQMDQIELDELKVRETLLTQKLEESL